MITREKAYRIAKRKNKNFKIIGCIELVDKYVFSFGVDGDDIPPGVPMISVSKKNGKIDYIMIPPIENLDILEKGKEFDLTIIKGPDLHQ